MSFILDALRKSEHARQHLGGATLAELPLGRRQRSQPWWVFVLAALLLVNLIVLGVVLLRKNPDSAAALPSAAIDTGSAAIGSNRTARAVRPTTSPAPLAEEAAEAPEVRYETIPRSESPFETAVPDGPPLVKPVESDAARTAIPLMNANGLPELRLDMHVYAKEPKERFVFINMHKYTEGQALTEGPRVAEITSDGVILFYQGQTLHMPRP